MPLRGRIASTCPTLDQTQVGESAMPSQTNTASPTGKPKKVQTNLSVPPHSQHVQVANHVPILQNSSDLTKTVNTKYGNLVEDGFVQVKTKPQKKR